MRGSFAFALVLSLALLACDKADLPLDADAESTAAPSDAGEAIASPAQLAGEYRVAGVGGEAIDLPYGITASISEDRIHVTAGCINMAWSYRFEQGVLETERVPVPSCRRALTPEEQAIADAFDAATAVSLNRANGFEFAGGGHSVTLFTQ